MKNANLPTPLTREINLLMAKCEAICDADPEMRDVVVMVYIGDIYSLREDIRGVDTAVQPSQLCSSHLDIDVV
jgi:hypothetical protein